MAVIAAGVVIGVGATVTLATWNDSEWVTGGASAANPYVGTSSFSILQNVSKGFDPSAWTDQPTQPGGQLDFALAAISLSPGVAVYAPVSLSTRAAAAGVPGSVAAKSLDLDGAMWATPTVVQTPAPTPAQTRIIPATSDDLWNAVRLRVVVTTNATSSLVGPPVCEAALFGPGATYVVGTEAEGAGIGVAGNVSRTLEKEGEDMQNYCFQIELPLGASSDLQGLKIAPAWRFSAESVTP
jgi:predicted ribosomally synthesized peptide with SipW-like signal peptide